MSTISGGSTPQLSIRGSINVPDQLRKLDEQAFTPQLISIGPIHRPNEKLQAMNKCKEWFCDCFIQWANINLQNLKHAIREKEDEIRSYYAQIIVYSISSDDFVTMILEDGMFLREYFLRQSNPHLVENDPMNIIDEWMPPILKLDLVLLENQLPFFVLEMLFEQANFLAELQIKPLSLRELAFEFFKCYNFQKIKLEDFNVKIDHFTDLVRFFYLSEQLLRRRPIGRWAKLSYTATQLHEAGVKFEAVKYHRGRRDFLKISFDLNNGVLKIPCVKLNEERVRLIRNIIALEQSFYVGHAYVTDFFIILDFLIDTSKDVDLLCDKGVLINYLGNSDIVASAVNSLYTNILWVNMNSEYWKICKDLNAFYKKPWHGWRATLWCQYFSTPWRAASTSAAVILLVLTAIQTVCSLKSTKW